MTRCQRKLHCKTAVAQAVLLSVNKGTHCVVRPDEVVRANVSKNAMLYLANRIPAQHAETQRALQAADGYLYLGLPEDALNEIGDAHPQDREHPSVLLARVRVLLHLKRWNEAEELSSHGSSSHPSEEEFTVQRAFALHQLQQGDKAVQVLLDAPEWVRRTGILHYNLACYEARLGDKNTARHCINAAIQLNAAMKKNARIDPDLQSLWN